MCVLQATRYPFSSRCLNRVIASYVTYDLHNNDDEEDDDNGDDDEDDDDDYNGDDDYNRHADSIDKCSYNE